DKGKTVLIVSHDLSTLQRLCSRLLWIDQGKLVMDGSPLEVLKAYAASIREQEEQRVRDKAYACHRAAYSLRNKGLIYGSGEILITEVQCLDREGIGKSIFSVGEPFTIRISYQTQVSVIEPVFVAAIYRVDGLRVCQVISSRDCIKFGKLDGKGFVDILFEQALLGPGQYVISAGIFPYVDLFDQIGQTPYDLHDRLYEFRIEPIVGCAIDLGVVLHPVCWRHSHGG